MLHIKIFSIKRESDLIFRDISVQQLPRLIVLILILCTEFTTGMMLLTSMQSLMISGLMKVNFRFSSPIAAPIAFLITVEIILE